jgi:hypothetical protein
VVLVGPTVRLLEAFGVQPFHAAVADHGVQAPSFLPLDGDGTVLAVRGTSRTSDARDGTVEDGGTKLDDLGLCHVNSRVRACVG